MRSREEFEETTCEKSIGLYDSLIMATNEYLKAMGWEEIVSDVDSFQLIPGRSGYELVVRFKGGRNGGKP